MELSSANNSFNYLKNSSDFLNIIMENMTSSVLMLNKNMELQAFNDTFKTMFSDKPDEYLLYKKCGDALGCAYAIDENTECGTTSNCRFCELRENALNCYVQVKPVYKHAMSREFYLLNSTSKVLKHLQFSIRPFKWKEDYYLVLFIEDITKLKEHENLIKELNTRLNERSVHN